MSKEIDEPTLLHRAAQAGAAVSVDQLKRWRRAGLIPRPRQEHRRGRRGSSSWYPVAAVTQLVAVSELHATTHRLADLVIATWWNGHWVERGALHRALTSRLERISAQARAVRAEHSDPFEAADEVVRSTTPRNGSPALALMRRRLPGGSRDLLELLWLFAVLAFGGEYDWAPDEADSPDDAPTLETLLTRAAGIDRAQREGLAGRDPLLPSEVRARDVIRELHDAGAFELEDLSRPVREATDSELDQARDDARLFAEPLTMIADVIQALVGEDAAGIGSLAALRIQSSDDRVAMIRSMLLLRRTVGGEGFARVGQTVDENYAVFAAIQQLRADLPEHAELLRLGRLERLSVLPDSQVARVRADLNGYLAEHPATARALGLDEPSDAAHDDAPPGRPCTGWC